MDIRNERLLSVKLYRTLVVTLLLLAGLLLFVLAVEPFTGARISRVALTRNAIEQCERIETEVVSEMKAGTLPNDVTQSYARLIKQSKGFKQGYIKVSEGDKAAVLDAWGQSLWMMSKSNLLRIPNVSPTLSTKTNSVIIWSSGPNGNNEFGTGDDVFLGSEPEKK
jgi:hypothetical protein